MHGVSLHEYVELFCISLASEQKFNTSRCFQMMTYIHVVAIWYWFAILWSTIMAHRNSQYVAMIHYSGGQFSE